MDRRRTSGLERSIKRQTAAALAACRRGRRAEAWKQFKLLNYNLGRFAARAGHLPFDLASGSDDVARCLRRRRWS